jgi:hypothetical protein
VCVRPGRLTCLRSSTTGSGSPADSTSATQYGGLGGESEATRLLRRPPPDSPPRRRSPELNSGSEPMSPAQGNTRSEISRTHIATRKPTPPPPLMRTDGHVEAVLWGDGSRVTQQRGVRRRSAQAAAQAQHLRCAGRCRGWRMGRVERSRGWRIGRVDLHGRRERRPARARENADAQPCQLSPAPPPPLPSPHDPLCERVTDLLEARAA